MSETGHPSNVDVFTTGHPRGGEQAPAAVASLLADLIRLNTVNPPGNERPAQELLASVLGDAGFDCTLVGRTPERPNLVARLAGEAPGPTLCLLSHVDTVLADPAGWSVDPWSGELRDGFVWGRGALDMKGQTAAEVAAACEAARAGWRPRRGDLIVVVVVDEERGGYEGAVWITAEHPELVRCDLLVNEGGGWRIEYRGDGDAEPRVIYGLGCAEKGVFRFTLNTDGVAGHASMPHVGDNALLKMAPLLTSLRERRPSFDVTAEPAAVLQAIGESAEGDLRDTLARVRGNSPMLAVMLEAMLGVTLAPTRIFASEKINVLPAHARLVVDCRVPPGLGEAEAIKRIREVVGEDGYRLEWTEQVPGNRSPFAGELVDFTREWIAAREPGAVVVPTVLPGFTDSRTFRAAFAECRAYGFFPHRYMPIDLHMPLIHGDDERVDVRDLVYATGYYADLVRHVLG